MHALPPNLLSQPAAAVSALGRLKTFWDAGGRILPLLIFVAVVLVLFRPWWQHGQVCAPLDIITNLYEPWANTHQPVRVKNHYATDAVEQYLLYHAHAQRSYALEQRHGWNIHKSGGTPAYLNTMATPGDWSFQLQRWLPFWSAWHLGLMGQLLIAMLGMYRLLRSQGIQRGLCVLGGLVFGLNSHFFAWMQHRWTLGAFCWTPWWLWTLEQLKQRKPAGALTPLFFALSLLGGHLQFAVFQFIILGCSSLDWLIQARTAGQRLLEPIVKIFAVGAIACGLAAYALLPSVIGYWNTLALGIRRGGLGYPDGIAGAFLNALAYPAYVFPFFFGAPNTLDMFKLFRSDLMMVPFFGSLLILMAGIGWFDTRRHRVARWLVAAGLLLPLTPLLGPLYQRLLILWIIGGIWLAILSLDAIATKRLLLLRRRLLFGYLLATLAVGVTGMGVRYQQSRITAAVSAFTLRQAQTHRFQARPDWFVSRALRFVEDGLPWRPGIAIPWLLFGLSIHLLRFRHRSWGGYALALIIAPQVGIYSSRFMVFTEPFGNERAIFPTTIETEAIQRVIGPGDRVHVRQQPDRLPLFPPNTLSFFGIASITGYDSILPNTLLNETALQTEDAAELGAAAVTHLVTFAHDHPPGAGWIFKATAGKIAIYSNTLANAWYTAETPAGRQPVKIEKPGHNHRRLRVPPETQRLWILENWDEGWRFRVNHRPWQRVQRTPDRSMVAELTSTAPNDIVELDFTPRWKIIGASFSGMAAWLYLALGVWSWRQRPGDLRHRRY